MTRTLKKTKLSESLTSYQILTDPEISGATDSDTSLTPEALERKYLHCLHRLRLNRELAKSRKRYSGLSRSRTAGIKSGRHGEVV